jgi:anti-anti-sigma factor
MLRIDIQSENGTAILYCSGRVVFGMEVETLRTIARSRTERSLNIDLEEVETIDASGLGLLVELQDWARRDGRALKFQNASDFVGRLIALTRLNEVLSLPIVSLPQSNAGCTFAAASFVA